MSAVFRYTLRRLRGQILGWGIGIGALALLLVPFYSTVQAKQEDFVKMVENYPPEFMAFFGGSDAAAILTPQGYLNYYLFSFLPVIVGIYAVLAGSALLASDEEGGQLDLILAHPVSRTGLFLGRLLAFVAAGVGVAAIGWLGLALPSTGSALNLSWGRIALPFIPVLAQVLIYGTLGLLLSMLLPSRGLAAAGAGLVLVGGYVLSSLANLHENLAAIARLLPFEYYQGGRAMAGLNVGWLAGLTGVSALFALVAWWRFQRRDVRVSGEGSWGLPALWRRRGAAGAGPEA